jgi:hypothetical protein
MFHSYQAFELLFASDPVCQAAPLGDLDRALLWKDPWNTALCSVEIADTTGQLLSAAD